MKKLIGTICLILFGLGFTSTVASQSPDQALQDLNSPDADLRRQASERLIEAGSASVAPLIDLLQNGNSSVRKEAALILGAIGDTRAVKPLVNSLKDNNSDVRWAAIWSLVQIGSAAVAELIQSFDNGGPGADAGAEIALSKIGAPAVPQLVEALESENTNIRRHCARLLGRIGDSSSTAALRKLLQDENQAVRSEASIALSKIAKE